MTKPDLKHLIVLFLAIAALISSGAFALSNHRLAFSSNQAALRAAESKTDVTVDDNAFVESLPETSFAPQAQSGPDALLPPPSASPNLTENLAQNLAREVIQANPSGPALDFDGALAIDAPDIESFLSTFSDSLEIPGEERVPAPVSPDTLYLVGDTPENAQAYFSSLADVMDRNILRAGVQELASGAPSLRAANSIKLAVTQARLDAEELRVPEPLAELHVRMLTLLRYEQQFLELGGETGDPLKAALALKTQEGHYDRAMEAVREELDALDELSLLPAPLSPPSFLARARSFLFGHTAHAFGSLVFDPALFAQEIKDFSFRTILETLKNQLIARLVDGVLLWVQNGGDPRFITDWKGFLSDAFNEAAGAAIEEQLPSLCAPFRNVLRLQLIPQRQLFRPLTCTLDQVVSNIKAFHDDFRTGGWVAYAAALQPNNNFYGAFIQLSDLALREATRAEDARKSDAVAGQGFLSTRICVAEDVVTLPAPVSLDAIKKFPDFSSEAPGSCQSAEAQQGGEECLDPNDPTTCQSVAPVAAGAVCTAYRRCTQYQNTTPGSFIAAAASKNIGGSAQERIVNATGFEGLVAALIDSAINRLIQRNDSGLLGTRPRTVSRRSSGDPRATFFDEAYAVLHDKEATLLQYREIVAAASSTAALEERARLACGGPPQEPPEPEEPLQQQRDDKEGSGGRRGTGDDTARRAARGRVSVATIYIEILARAEELRAELDELKDFLDAVESAPDAADYSAKLAELNARFGTPVDSGLEFDDATELLTVVGDLARAARERLNQCTASGL